MRISTANFGQAFTNLCVCNDHAHNLAHAHHLLAGKYFLIMKDRADIIMSRHIMSAEESTDSRKEQSSTCIDADDLCVCVSAEHQSGIQLIRSSRYIIGVLSLASSLLDGKRGWRKEINKKRQKERTKERKK